MAAPLGPAAGAPAPAASPPGKNRTLMIVLLVVVFLVGGVAISLIAITVLGDSDAASASEVQREPISSATDPFAPPGQIGQDQAIPPVQTQVPTKVEGGKVGLYGGTMNSAACDKNQLTAFLQQNPDKASAWASTVGINPSDIPTYVAGLTPVLLRSDTAVTNHGFKDGKATSIPAVLQAGTAVLVDDKGMPVTKCYCGNPLQPPTTYTNVPPPAPTTSTTAFQQSTTTQPTTTTTYYDETPPTYYGPEWPGWTPTSVTIIQINVTVINVFVLVDPTTGTTFSRPVGTDGTADTPYDGPTVPDEPCVDESNTIVPCPTPGTPGTPGPSYAPAPSNPPPSSGAPSNPTPSSPSTTTSTTYQPTYPNEPCVDENNNIVPCGSPPYSPSTTAYRPPSTYEPSLPNEPCVDENNNIVPCG